MHRNKNNIFHNSKSCIYNVFFYKIYIDFPYLKKHLNLKAFNSKSLLIA